MTAPIRAKAMLTAVQVTMSQGKPSELDYAWCHRWLSGAARIVASPDVDPADVNMEEHAP